jgi:hypothetical protein
MALSSDNGRTSSRNIFSMTMNELGLGAVHSLEGSEEDIKQRTRSWPPLQTYALPCTTVRWDLGRVMVGVSWLLRL